MALSPYLRVSLQLRALQYMSTMRRSKSELLMYLSVLVPVFNEAESLPHLLEQIANALAPLSQPFEVICVDDGSNDGSFDVLRS